MKRIEPVTSYSDDLGYPAVDAHDSTRRDFLGWAVAGAAAVGGALLLPSVGEARPSTRQRVTFRIHFPKTYRPCGLMVTQIIIQTWDSRFADYLRNPKKHPAVEAALATVLGKQKCADLQDQRRLAKLRKKLAGALVKNYRKATGRRAALPIVSLVVQKHRRRPPLPGGRRPPIRPQPIPRP